MKFYDENNRPINTVAVEAEEQRLAGIYVSSDATVLELGARYGTVTCAISRKLTNKNNLVTVEPDSRVWAALESNLARNQCTAHIIKGFISKRPLSLTNHNNAGGYGTTFQDTSGSTGSIYTLDSIQSMYSLTFDTLVADCEGFLERFFDENPTLYDQLKTVIFEADYPDKCNYTKIRETLKNKGFREIHGGFQNVWSKVLYPHVVLRSPLPQITTTNRFNFYIRR